MKSGVSGRQVRVILSVVVSGVVILYFYSAFVSWLAHDAAEMEKQLHSAEEQLKVLETSTANEAALQEQYRQVDETVTSLRKTFPVEEELPAVIELLSALASKTNIKIQTIFPQRPSGSPQAMDKRTAVDPLVYKEIPIQIDALAGYHELGTFLSLVETGERPMQVVSLRISGSAKEPRRHQVNLVLRSYFAIADEATGNKKTPIAPPSGS